MNAMTTEGRMTWKQIREHYPQQWVVLIDHERLPHDIAGFKTARVLAVGDSRVEAQERARPELDSISGGAFLRPGAHRAAARRARGAHRRGDAPRHPNPFAAHARITVTRLPAGLVSSLAVSRSSTGGSPGRRSKITSHPLSSPSPAR
jgi:hypothetical protein